MEKPQLVNFIAKVLEDSGFKVYKNFKTSQQTVDIYAVLPTSMGDFGMVVACKNYDKEWEVGIDVLKEMEVIGKKLKASKVSVVTSSGFSSQAKRYAEERKIKLVDRNDLVALAKRYNNKKKKEPARLRRDSPAEIDRDSFYNRDVNLDYIDNVDSQASYDRGLNRIPISYDDYDDYDEEYNRSSGSRVVSEYERSLNRIPNPYDSYDEYENDVSYYESQVGGVDLRGYSEYDDDLYRAEFLNRHPDTESGFSNRLIANNQDPYVNSNLVSNNSRNPFKNTGSVLSSLGSRGYTQSISRSEPSHDAGNKTRIKTNRSNNRSQSQSNSRFIAPRDSGLSNYQTGMPGRQFLSTIKPLLGNVVVSIIVVVIIAYLIAFILGSIVKVPTGYLGLTELVVALVLSYGLVFYADRSADTLVKGTIVFFVSLVILMAILIAF